MVLRWLTCEYFRRVPDATTFLRLAQTIQPETLHLLNDRPAQLAAQARVTRARKLRVDGAVAETTIHHPTAARMRQQTVLERLRTEGDIPLRRQPQPGQRSSHFGHPMYNERLIPFARSELALCLAPCGAIRRREQMPERPSWSRRCRRKGGNSLLW